MATDLERLVVSLDADITRLTKQLSKAGVAMDATARDLDTKSKRAAKAVNDNLGEVGEKGLNHNQFQILGHVARSTFEAISAGASPLRVIAQEGVKASAALGDDGLAGLVGSATESLLAMVSPASLAAGGVVAVGGAALYAATSVKAAQEQIRIGLSGIGAASHATARDVDEIGDRLAETQKIGIAAGRDIALSLARTGQIDVANIEPVGNLARGFATLTGTDLAEAGKQLAGIFSDPAKGAATLNAVIGSLDDQTLQYVQTLTRQGDRQQAIAVLAAAAQPQIKKAADNTGLWARSWEAVANAAERAKNAVGGAVLSAIDGPTLEQQRDQLQRRIDTAQSYKGDSSFFAFGGAGVPEGADNAAEIEGWKNEKAAIQAKIDAKAKSDKQDADAKAAAALTVQAGNVVRAYDELATSIQNVEADLSQLGKGIAGALSDPGQKIDGGVANAVERYGALQGKLAQMKSDYEAGGAAAAAALREADFSKQIAGATTYAKGLAEINHRYDEQIIAARANGSVKAIPTLEEARQSAVAGYGRDAQERATNNFKLPDDFVRTVFGAEGNSARKNPSSSASGIGQFVDDTFIEQYRKVFSDAASSMNEEAILALKKDAEVNKALAENYGKEIGAGLAKDGIEPSLRNIYLGYHFGPGGVRTLLAADPDASAATTLGAKVFKANSREIGDKTNAQLIAAIDARVQRNSAAGRSQQDQIVAERASADAIGKSAAEQARLSAIQEQLNAEREKGSEIGQQFTTAQDLIKASSDKLTPALAAQRTAVLALGDERARAAQSGLSARFQNDLADSRAALGRTPDQQAIYERARTYAGPNDPNFGAITDSLTKLHAMTEAKEDSSSFVKDLVGDLQQGRSAADAFSGALQRVASKAADQAIDSIFSKLFSGALSGGGGGFASLFGFADGGLIAGAGTGTSDSILARVSNGEFIMNARATKRARPLLEAINSGRRFASGGAVGLRPMSQAAMIGMGAAGPLDARTTYAIDARGAQAGVAEQIGAALRAYDAEKRRTQYTQGKLDRRQFG